MPASQSQFALTLGQISDTRIVISVDPPDTSGEDLNFPDKCRVVKLANSVTYDRLVDVYGMKFPRRAIPVTLAL